MSLYTAQIHWIRKENEPFTDNAYSRGHTWKFDGGLEIPASSSPQIVPLPYSIDQNVDPEEALIASVSSCHMLFFLSFAAKRQFLVDQYTDQAIGKMASDSEGKTWMTQITLRPKITFNGTRQPTIGTLEKIHEQAHQACFIANSLKTKVNTEIIL